MIKNIIFDVGMVLVNWDPHAAFQISPFSYVERGYEAILSGEKRLLEMLNLEKGEICIGASDMTLKYYLLRI